MPSLSIGILFVLFPRFVGVWFCRIGKAIWKGHEDDSSGKISGEIAKAFPSLSIEKIYDEATAAKKFRILGIVFLAQALVFFILSVVL